MLRVAVVVRDEGVDDEPGVVGRTATAPAAVLHRQDAPERVLGSML
jgi:hypothetical protein